MNKSILQFKSLTSISKFEKILVQGFPHQPGSGAWTDGKAEFVPLQRLDTPNVHTLGGVKGHTLSTTRLIARELVGRLVPKPALICCLAKV